MGNISEIVEFRKYTASLFSVVGSSLSCYVHIRRSESCWSSESKDVSLPADLRSMLAFEDLHKCAICEWSIQCPICAERTKPNLAQKDFKRYDDAIEAEGVEIRSSRSIFHLPPTSTRLYSTVDQLNQDALLTINTVISFISRSSLPLLSSQHRSLSNSSHYK